MIETANGALLFTLICTLSNGIFYLTGSDYRFFYAVKLPAFLGKWGLPVYLLAFLLSIVLYGGAWVLSSKRKAFLLIGALLLGADFCLCGIALATDGLTVLSGCDLLFHALLIVLLVKGYIAAKKLAEQEKAEQATLEMLNSMMGNGDKTDEEHR